MACFYPLQAYRVSTPGGVDKIVFSERKKHEGRNGVLRPGEIACGQCFGCRLERSRQWAMRCMHEASLYDENCFLTLTYDDAHLPARGSLNYPDFQGFLKRLRQHVRREEIAAGVQKENFRRIRFFMCGEYGDTTGRAHYHALLFNYRFLDATPVRMLDAKCQVFNSKLLEQLWPLGQSSIGEVTFESAAYVARYCMKKVTGVASIGPSQTVPEFAHMSLKPGIGAPWLQKYETDVYPRDYVIVNEQKVKPPKFYDKIYSQRSPEQSEWIKYERALEADKHLEDNTFERLAVKETVARAKAKHYSKRTI